jgi:hypothetical protein
MTKAERFIGIDVAQATLEIAVRPTGESWQVVNDEVAFGALVDRLRELAPTLIVLEATGGIQLPVVGALAAAGPSVVAINPRQVHDFAKGSVLKYAHSGQSWLFRSDGIGGYGRGTSPHLLNVTAKPFFGTTLQGGSWKSGDRHD